MLSLEHKFLKWDWANRYFPPDKLFPDPRGAWEGERRTWSLLRGKPCATRFSPQGRDVAGPRTLPLLRLLLVRCVWRCLAGLQAPLGDYEPQRRSTKAGQQQQGDVTARPRVVVDAAAVAAFCELCGVTPATALGLSDELDVSAQLMGASRLQRDAWLEDLSHILLWRLDVIGYSCFFIELVSLGEKEVGGQGSAPSQIVLLLKKALFAFGWSSLPSLHCSPESPLPPTCPPRNPCLGAERWGLEDAAGHGDPSTCSQGFSGSRWSGLRHLRQEMNHLTLGWLIILPSLFSIFSQQSLFSPTKNYFKKSHREV